MDTSNEDQLIKQLLANYKTPGDLIGEGGLLKRLTKKYSALSKTDPPILSKSFPGILI